MNSTLVRIVAAWESVQVELHGRYSLERLLEIMAHSRTTTRFKNYATLLLVPLPGLACLVLLDLIPLSPPADGFAHQGVGIFVRIWATILLRVWVILFQVRVSSPSLVLSTRQILVLSTVVPLAAELAFVALGRLWAFPTPFFALIQQLPGAVVTIATLRWFWRDVLRLGPLVKAKLLRYLKVMRIQMSVLATYITYCVVFCQASASYQPLVALVLPGIKLLFKNKTRDGLYYLEDLAPCVIVSNIDVFHAIFVSATTQQAKGTGSIGVVMLIDLAQAVVAYVDIRMVERRIRKSAEESKELDKYTSSSAVRRNSSRHASSRLASLLTPQLGVVDYCIPAQRTALCYPSIRGHQPRYVISHLKSDSSYG